MKLTNLPAITNLACAAACAALPLAAGFAAHAAGVNPQSGIRNPSTSPRVVRQSPNIVVILADDLGIMDIGCYNPKTFYETPNLDRLGRQGARFTDGYAANPVCSPTRFSMMTGRYPTRAGLTNYLGAGAGADRAGTFLPAQRARHMPLDEVTLAQGLRDAGYQTFFVGKWHLGEEEKYWPENRGFDVNIGGHRGGAPTTNKNGTAKGYFSPYGNPRLKDGPPGEYLTARLAEESVNLLRKAAADNAAGKGRPFLLYKSFYSVHTPLQAPAATVEKYRKKAARLGLGDGRGGNKNARDFATEEQVWPGEAQERQVRIRQSHAVYAAMVEEMDKAVGRILDALDELGLAENTIVIFTSDNGGLSTSEGSPTSNLPYRAGKGWLYEGGIREPWLIRWPGVVKENTIIGTPIISNDVLPTAFAAAGAPLPKDKPIDGRDLVPLLKRGEAPARDALFWHYPHYSNQGGFPGAAVRMGDWKLIERLEDGRMHLYNLRDDPGERNDLAEKDLARVAAMRERLHAWYRETDARFLRPKPGGPAPWKAGKE